LKQHLHRSENLLISLLDNKKEIEFEIRFSDSYSRGTCDALCPRCGNPVAPQRWELEGPDGSGNTVWFVCVDPLNGEEGCGEELDWTRRVTFQDWIEEDE
jgi:hypothetical protein